MLWDLIKAAWRPALEILMLAVGIYYAFAFARRTRGAAVFTGFLVLLLSLTLLTNALHLEVLSWILQRFFAFFVVAVLILFQPELRRFLAELGSLPWFVSAHEQRENIEIIVQTAERLSEARIGALIAVEQTIPLSDAVESGILVDCEATPEMLETIFFPNNAVHDGGVILRGDRITHAACIFPLSQRMDLQKSMGTRHRAAIGLTEETDAAVVVVSEETGAISYAHRGELTRGVSLEVLRSFLTSILLERAKPRTLARWLRSKWAALIRASVRSRRPSNAPTP
jgi:diadenylate cyclase